MFRKSPGHINNDVGFVVTEADVPETDLQNRRTDSVTVRNSK